jgi:hypothetical protein
LINLQQSAGKKASKPAKKKVKVKKGSEYACGYCGNAVTVETVERIDGVYGYIEEDAIICCGEVMKEK